MVQQLRLPTRHHRKHFQVEFAARFACDSILNAVFPELLARPLARILVACDFGQVVALQRVPKFTDNLRIKSSTAFEQPSMCAIAIEKLSLLPPDGSTNAV